MNLSEGSNFKKNICILFRTLNVCRTRGDESVIFWLFKFTLNFTKQFLCHCERA